MSGTSNTRSTGVVMNSFDKKVQEERQRLLDKQVLTGKVSIKEVMHSITRISEAHEKEIIAIEEKCIIGEGNNPHHEFLKRALRSSCESLAACRKTVEFIREMHKHQFIKEEN